MHQGGVLEAEMTMGGRGVKDHGDVISGLKENFSGSGGV